MTPNQAGATAASPRGRAILMLLACAILWSTGGLMIKAVAWNALAIAGARSAIAAPLILAFAYAHRRPRFTLSAAQVGGAVAYAATVTTFVAATKLTTAANAILLQYTAPVYIALFGAYYLKERASRRDWAMIGLIFGGMTLFFLDDLAPGNALGNALAILSGVSFASIYVFLRRQKDESALESVFLGNVLTAIIGLPFMFDSPPGLTGWLAVAYLGLFQIGLAYVLFALGLKHVQALEAVLIQTVEPVLNPVWVFLFLGEVPGPWALAGGVIVLGAVTARSFLAARANGGAKATAASEAGG